MQALESLNDSQVNDFLSGKTPLNLSMRLGDHMMLIQLQLSTVNPAGGTTASTAALPPVVGGNSSVGGCSGSTSSSHSASSGALGCIYPSSSVDSHLSHARTRSSSHRLGSGRISNGHVHSHQHPSLHHSHSHHRHHHHQHHNATAMAAGSAGTHLRKLDLERSGNNKSRRSTTTETTTISSDSDNSSSSLSGTTAGNGRGHHAIKTSDLSSFLSKRDYESLHNIVKSIAPRAAAAAAAAVTSQMSRQPSTAQLKPLLEQSPIKSLSNLVSSPIKTTAIKNIHIAHDSNSTSSLPPSIVGRASPTSCTSGGCHQDPIAAKLTSCLCTRLATASAASEDTKSIVASTPPPTTTTTTTTPAPPPPSPPTSSPTSTPPPAIAASRTLPNLNIGAFSRTSVCSGTVSNSGSGCVVDNSLRKTVNNPITVTRSKHRHHHHHHHHQHHYHHAALAAAARLKSQEATLAKSGTPIADAVGTTRTSSTAELDDAGVTLAEASRNLTQTLRKLSKEVFTNKIDLSGGGNMGVGAGIGGGEETPRKSGSGAVIESMKNHGKGIYSGTFSGTLNPALQDRFGRPKRDISTVIHILNDLLSATPQYSRGARISFEAPSSSNTSMNSNSSISSSNSNSSSSNNGSTISSSINTSCGNAGAAKTAAPTSVPVALHHNVRSKLYSTKHHNCAKCNSRAQQQQAAAVLSAGNCAYGESNGHYLAKEGISTAIASSLKSYTHGCCTDADISSTDSASNTPAMDSSNGCMCRNHGGGVRLNDGQRDHMCQKCIADLANLKTKSKLDQLRLVMQQRKQKREARKLKSTPYDANAGILTATVEATPQYSAVSALVTTPLPAVKTKHSSNSNNTTKAAAAATTASPSEVSPNHIVEEVDTAA
ncbi:PREDICTED: mucin-5AC [Drosophila arizonae]|uniref:Mucin-5AC n=1 Tax=Drosophila arizonae TaxID=7263 RepID=A0ABM1PPN0_DROAR|nr:PREDICTED: mucin-5AC [Drosophila arizonae]